MTKSPDTRKKKWMALSIGILMALISIVIDLGAIAFHFFTTYIAYKAGGYGSAFISLALPVFAEMYWFVAVWHSSGIFFNVYSLLAFAVLVAKLCDYIIARAFAHYAAKSQQKVAPVFQLEPQIQLIPSLVVQADFHELERPQIEAAFRKMKRAFNQESFHGKVKVRDGCEVFEIMFLQKHGADSEKYAGLLEKKMKEFLLAEGFTVKRQKYSRWRTKPTAMYMMLVATRVKMSGLTFQKIMPPYIQTALDMEEGTRVYETAEEVREDMESGKLKPIEGTDCGHLTHLFEGKGKIG